MKDKLPTDWKDYPRPYVGQPRRPTGDDYSTFRDVSAPQDIGRERGPMDALDPDLPVGSQHSPKPTGGKRRSINWEKNKDKKKD